MEPLTALVVDYVKGQLIDRVVGGFRTHVIERWTKRRAETFFKQFCLTVSADSESTDPDQLDEMLDRLLRDETCSEILFDAYRSVCFSRSKEMGPKIIAILAAELVLKRRRANLEEDELFWAAENLDDEELREFAAFFDKEHERAQQPPEKPSRYSSTATLGENGNAVRICWYKEQFDSNTRTSDPVSVAPMNLTENVGSWAEKLRSRGILTDDVKEGRWEYSEDSEQHIYEDGSVRELSWWLYLGPTAFRLRELVARVDRSEQAT